MKIHFYVDNTTFMYFVTQPKHTWHSYGRKAMLISFMVLILRAAIDLQMSLNISSGQTACLRVYIVSFVDGKIGRQNEIY